MVNPTVKPDDLPRYLNHREVAGYIRRTPDTVRVMTSKRQIPHIKYGRSVIYDRVEIDRWLAGQAVPAER